MIATRIIRLLHGEECRVDADIFDELNRHTWLRSSRGTQKDGDPIYAARYVGRGREKRLLFMHRVINQTPDDLITDHIDGNGLNNTRANLRSVTHTQNMQNRQINRNSSSGFKGVSWDAERRLWSAAISSSGRRYKLGRFATKDEAAAAYASAAARLHGEYACIERTPPA